MIVLDYRAILHDKTDYFDATTFGSSSSVWLAGKPRVVTNVELTGVADI